jgi:hypothetical protein
LSKAYDVINYDILLDKLNSYGITGKSNLWFKSYLSYKFQFVEIKDTDCSNSVKKLHFIMHERGAWCAARIFKGQSWYYYLQMIR